MRTLSRIISWFFIGYLGAAVFLDPDPEKTILIKAQISVLAFFIAAVLILIKDVIDNSRK